MLHEDDEHLGIDRDSARAEASPVRVRIVVAWHHVMPAGVATTTSRSGFKCTAGIGVQSRVRRLHRSGVRCWAHP